MIKKITDAIATATFFAMIVALLPLVLFKALYDLSREKPVRGIE